MSNENFEISLVSMDFNHNFTLWQKLKLQLNKYGFNIDRLLIWTKIEKRENELDVNNFEDSKYYKGSCCLF